ncbi:Cathepsin L-like proteinase [Schistosoma japonicum]|nr:Cathepsin L-like proteinase [Schistosoma japonicum]
MITWFFYLHLIIYIYANHTYINIDNTNNSNNNYSVTDHTEDYITTTTTTTTTTTNSYNGNKDDKLLWLKWKSLHHKHYSTQKEYDEHYENWQYNLHLIRQHNKMQQKGLELYTTGLNEFSDLNWSHISAVYLTNLSQFVKNHNKQGLVLLKQSLNDSISKEIPGSWDWRNSGIVSKVKSTNRYLWMFIISVISAFVGIQGKCGACWAFSAAGALEGQLKNKTGRFIELSSQQLIDCSHSFGNHGCLGGDMNNAFRYVEKYGIQSEESYPYLTKEGECQPIKSSPLTYSKSIIEIKSNDEEQLKYVLYEYGPVSAGINVEQQFMRYKNGIYHSKSCSSADVNHAVLIVGYGEENGIQYWIIKNSWGIEWGENGYARIRRNYNNMCGIATMASVPKL